MTVYNYSISATTPRELVNEARLTSEIQANANITKTLTSVTVSQGSVDIDFTEDLTVPEQTELVDVVLANHIGIPLTALLYSISADVPFGRVNGDRLTSDIEGNANITKTLVSVTVQDNDLVIDFDVALSAAEQTELVDVVLADHIGIPLTAVLYSVALDVPAGKVNGKNLAAQIQSSEEISYAFKSIDVEGDRLIIDFKGILSEAEKAVLKDTLLTSHTGKSITRTIRAADGVPIYHLEPRPDVTTPNIISMNWCDNTTWYFTGERVTEEVLTNSGDNTTYTSANSTWVDLTHGKVTQEHRIEADHSVVVLVDDVAQTENSIGSTDGDYTVDYGTGEVTFNSALPDVAVVKATYSKVVNSTWKIVPKAGKKLSLRAVEVQFSTDVDLLDTAVFEIKGPVETFAPHLVDNPLPAGTLIPLRKSRYPRMHNYIDEAQHAYPNIPKLGGSSWRGMQHDMHVFRWPYTHDYGQYIELKSSQGMELWVYLENHQPLGGERAVVSIYARSVDEE